MAKAVRTVAEPAEIERGIIQDGALKLAVTDPEYTISVIGLVSSFLGQPIVGLVLSAIALKQSRAANRSNTYAFLGLIFSIVLLSLYVLFIVLYAAFIGVLIVSAGQGGWR